MIYSLNDGSYIANDLKKMLIKVESFSILNQDRKG